MFSSLQHYGMQESYCRAILVLLLVYICWLGIMGAVGPCHPEIQGCNDYSKYLFMLPDNNSYEIYIMALLVGCVKSRA